MGVISHTDWILKCYIFFKKKHLLGFNLIILLSSHNILFSIFKL